MNDNNEKLSTYTLYCITRYNRSFTSNEKEEKEQNLNRVRKWPHDVVHSFHTRKYDHWGRKEDTPFLHQLKSFVSSAILLLREFEMLLIAIHQVFILVYEIQF
jgi:hypothetical protein